MGTMLRGIKRLAIHWLSLDRMDERFNVLALNYVFLMVYYIVETVFINTLILRISDGDMYTVFIYRGFSFAFSAVGMLLCSVFSGKLHSVMAVRLAGVSYALLFVVVFACLDYLSLPLMYAMGALCGLAGGLYWSGHNVLLANYTTQQNRATGLAIMGVVQGALTLLVPLVSGAVIQALPGMSGYRVMFGVAVLTIICQARFIKKLALVERRQKPKRFQFAFKLITKKLTLRMMLAAEMLRGFRDGALLFFLNILLFKLVENESLVGLNSFLTGMLSILANWVYAKIAAPKRRLLFAGFAITILLGLSSLLQIYLGAWSIILFTMFNAFLSYFIVNATINNSLDLFAGSSLARQVMTELMGFRELALSAGRISGLIVATLFPKNMAGYVWTIMVLTASQYIAVLLLVAIQRIQTRKQRPGKGASNEASVE